MYIHTLAILRATFVRCFKVFLPASYDFGVYQIRDPVDGFVSEEEMDPSKLDSVGSFENNPTIGGSPEVRQAAGHCWLHGLAA